MSGTTVSLKPTVYWNGAQWVAELNWISWVDWTPYDTWERAIDHALWLGLCAGVWRIRDAD